MEIGEDTIDAPRGRDAERRGRIPANVCEVQGLSGLFGPDPR